MVDERISIFYLPSSIFHPLSSILYLPSSIFHPLPLILTQSVNPEIVIEFRDQVNVSDSDTSLITIFLDDERVNYGTGAGF